MELASIVRAVPMLFWNTLLTKIGWEPRINTVEPRLALLPRG